MSPQPARVEASLAARHFHRIVFPGTVLNFGNGINARGDSWGIQRYARHPAARLLLSQGHFVAIDFPGAVRSTAFDINERGDIVGAYVGADGTTRLYLLSSGVFTTIDIPGALGTLGTGRRARSPGSMRGGNRRRLSRGRWQDSRLSFEAAGFGTIDFPDTMSTRPTAINPQGDIVGYYRDLAGRDHGFLIRR